MHLKSILNRVEPLKFFVYMDTAVASNTTWENVFRSVKHAVLWGVVHRDLSGIEAIGVDEIQWRSGHTYLTLVYQITGVK